MRSSANGSHQVIPLGNGSAQQFLKAKKPQKPKPDVRRKSVARENGAKPKSKNLFHREKFLPDASWSLEDLETEIAHEQTAVIFHERKMAIHTYRLGRALALARQKVGHGDWGQLLKKHGVSAATDCRARQLFDRAPSEQTLNGLAIKQAYERFGIPTGKDTPAKLGSRNGRTKVTAADQAAESKSGQSKSNAVMPTPPKEDSDCFGMRLAHLVSRAEWLAENVHQSTATKSERMKWLSMAEQARMAATKIMEALRAG